MQRNPHTRLRKSPSLPMALKGPTPELGFSKKRKKTKGKGIEKSQDNLKHRRNKPMTKPAEETSKMATIKAVMNKTVSDVLPKCISDHVPAAVKGTGLKVAVPVVAVASYLVAKTLRRVFGRKESK